MHMPIACPVRMACVIMMRRDAPTPTQTAAEADQALIDTHNELTGRLMQLPARTDSFELTPAPATEDVGSEEDGCSNTVAFNLKARWHVCDAAVRGAVLAWRGLRVRMGLHAALDTATSVTFNTVMQRYHYTGGRTMHGRTYSMLAGRMSEFACCMANCGA